MGFEEFKRRFRRGFGRQRIWMLILAVIAALLAVMGPQMGFQEAFLCLMRGAAAAAAIIWGIATFGGQGSPHWKKINIINNSDRPVKDIRLKKHPPTVPPGPPVHHPLLPPGQVWSHQVPYSAPFDYAVKEIEVEFDLEAPDGTLQHVQFIAKIDSVLWPSPNEYVDEIWMDVYGPQPMRPSSYGVVEILRHAQDTADPLNESPATIPI